ncbi:Uncharacterized conserved protein [uncultured Avibacterium sp.]|uniref:Uncharacterized conserved protein n=1 Tax=uncultured Avibacterium sp. TaxID=1936169 RepID=A0A486XA37_9PAST|nr:Uncharacterized conserved protein [uncultured Avibacterium sp.]
MKNSLNLLVDNMNNALEKQVEQARLTVSTDGYSMSIGELVNLYDDQELNIHPEFQRIYRWNDYQRSKFIESIFLGIPLPSIFVAQNSDGVWEVVDGLQRLSTIFQFMGKLKDENGKIEPYLELQSTKYLTELKDITWKNEDKNKELTSALKLDFKRARMDIKIISRNSDSDTKLELFQRLNTGGSELKPQEVRNCVLLMINKDIFNMIKECSENDDFRETLPITERKENESHYAELALRFFIQRYFELNNPSSYSYVNEYLDNELIRLFSKDSNFDIGLEKVIFTKTFQILNRALGDDCFKKYQSREEKYKGSVSLPVFEVISTATSRLVENNIADNKIIELIQSKSKLLPEDSDFLNSLRANNTRPIERTINMLKLSERIFNEN